MLNRRGVWLAAVLGALLLFAPAPAVADELDFVLWTGNDGLSGVPAPYATVHLELVGDTIQVTVAATSGFGIFGQGGAFGLNVSGSTDGLSLSGLPSGFSAGSPGQMDGFGSFELVINGTPAADRVSSFSFTVARSGGFTSVSQLVEGNASGNAFAAHIWTTGGVTGFASTGTDPVPEPASLALFGSGLLAVAGFLRRRRSAA